MPLTIPSINIPLGNTFSAVFLYPNLLATLSPKSRRTHIDEHRCRKPRKNLSKMMPNGCSSSVLENVQGKWDDQVTYDVCNDTYNFLVFSDSGREHAIPVGRDRILTR
jgi:hypothetical protein